MDILLLLSSIISVGLAVVGANFDAISTGEPHAFQKVGYGTSLNTIELTEAATARPVVGYGETIGRLHHTAYNQATAFDAILH